MKEYYIVISDGVIEGIYDLYDEAENFAKTLRKYRPCHFDILKINAEKCLSFD